MKKIAILFFVISIVILMTSCDSVLKSSDEHLKAFGLTVKLVDSENQPLEGYSACIYPDYPQLHGKDNSSKARATIAFTNPSRSRVQVEVYDYFGNHKALLVDELKEIGYHFIVYGLEDSVSDGIYKVILKRYDDETLLDSLSCNIYKFCQFDLTNAKYETDDSGLIKETSRQAFPYLYFNEELRMFSEDGSELDSLVFSPTTIIEVRDNNGLTKKASFNIANGKNNLELNWDDMEVCEDKKPSFFRSKSIKYTANVTSYKDSTDAVSPPTQASLKVYPNPFN